MRERVRKGESEEGRESVRESKPNAHDMIYTPSVFVCCMLLSCMLILRIYSPSLSEANDMA